MSSKADTLLKKANSFEKLALYSDRRSFLQALAQTNNTEPPSTDPAPWRTYDQANDPRGNQNNWVPQVQNGQRTYYYTGPALPAGGVPNQPSFYDKNIRPHQFPTDPNVVLPPADDSSHPVDRDQSILLNKYLPGKAVPEQAAPAGHPANYNKNTVLALQNFLNKALRPDFFNGQLRPVKVDGLLGPETTGALNYWASKNNMPSNNIQALVDTALKSARA
jgi:hypothetical protein